MTITSTQNRVSYDGDGELGVPGTTVFAVPFRFLQPSDLVVLVRVDATGVSTTKTLDTHYSLAGEGAAAGGAVTFLIEDGEPQTGETLVIYGNPPMTQAYDFQSGDPFPAETHEEALDKLTLQGTRTREIAESALFLTDSSTDGSGEYDANGNDIDAVGTLTATKVTGLADPTATTDSANKNYVDATVSNTIGPIPDGDTYVTATGSTTARTIADRWSDTYNVKDFGAVGDGEADDTAALQAALTAVTALEAQEGGIRRLYWPDGTYLTSLKLTLNPVGIYEFGPDVTIKATAAMDYVMGTEQPGGARQTFHINNGPFLDANDLATHGAYFYKVQFSRNKSITGLYVENSVAEGIHFFSCQGGVVGGMVVRYAGTDGFWFTSCNSMKVYGTKVFLCGGSGYRVRGSKAATITNVTQALPAVVTSAGHGFPNGELVTISSVVGMTQLNGNTYTVAGRATDTFQLASVNSTEFGEYGSGGTATGGTSGGMSFFGINSESNTGHGFVCDNTSSPVFVYGAWIEANVGDGYRVEGQGDGGGIFNGSITGFGSGTNSMINLGTSSAGFDIDASAGRSGGDVNWYTHTDLGTNNTIRVRTANLGTELVLRKERFDDVAVVDGSLLMQRSGTTQGLGGTGGILNGGIAVACAAAGGTDTFIVDIVTGAANSIVAADIELVGQYGPPLDRGKGLFKKLLVYSGISNGNVDGDPSTTEVLSVGDARKSNLTAAAPVTIDGSANGYRIVFTSTDVAAFTGTIRVIVHTDKGPYISTTVSNNQ